MLVTRPQLVLADEPTGSLDSPAALAILALLRELNAQGVTIVLVTHEREFARYARRVTARRRPMLSHRRSTDRGIAGFQCGAGQWVEPCGRYATPRGYRPLSAAVPQMRVAELMQTDVRTIAPDATVADIVRAMAVARVSGLPVADASGKVLGVVSTTDVLEAEAEQSDTRARLRLFEHTTAREIMSPSVDIIDPDADAREAALHMLYRKVRRLIVQEREKLVGVISQTDIAHAVATRRI